MPLGSGRDSVVFISSVLFVFIVVVVSVGIVNYPASPGLPTTLQYHIVYMICPLKSLPVTIQRIQLIRSQMKNKAHDIINLVNRISHSERNNTLQLVVAVRDMFGNKYGRSQRVTGLISHPGRTTFADGRGRLSVCLEC